MTTQSTLKPQTIVYVMSGFPVLSETFVTNEIRAMRKLGHRIVPTTLTRHDGPCQPEDEPMRDEAVLLTDVMGWRTLGIAPRRWAAAWAFAKAQTGIRPRSLMRSAARVADVVRHEGATHIHAHFAHSSAATAIAAARMTGVTVSFIGHGYDVYGTPSDLPLKLASADLVLATCQDMADDFRAWAPGANVVITSCGIDPTRFSPGAGPRNGRLLAIGRLAEQKGYPVLLDALAMIPEAQRPTIDAVGTGPLEAELKEAAVARGVSAHINFVGAKPSNWIASAGPSYLGLVAPFVVCANGDKDTGPVVVKESLAMGLPVVASALMGMKEMVTPECGKQVPPGDAAALAAAMVWLAGLDEATRTRMGAAGRAHVERNYTLAGQAATMTAAINAMQEHRKCAA